MKHNAKRFKEYLNSLVKGDKDVKVNSKTLYPHEILSNANGYGLKKFDSLSYEEKQLIESQWKALPNFMEGSKNSTILPVIDTSGSMYPHAIKVSVSLGLYLSERNLGKFKDTFITFDAKPALQELSGNSIINRVYQLRNINPSNTDLMAVFRLILNKAVDNKVPQEDMPSMVLILSDMEFDEACT